MSQPPLKKATITVLEGEQRNKVITVMFNPTEYTFDRSNSYKPTPIPGLGAPLLQFVNGESDQLTMDLFLDDYTDPRGPTSMPLKESDPLGKRVHDLTKLLEIDRTIHAPPPVRFDWDRMKFTAVIEKIGRKVTMFHPNGAPARVTLSMSFKEYRTLRQLVEDPRRESADKTRRRAVVGNESLWLMAAREYNDPNEWVRIAEQNDLDDPRAIAAGDWLELPPIENPNGTRRTI